MNISKNAFVTGATNGTGYAIATEFAKNGYNVVITSRTESAAIESASSLSADFPNVTIIGVGLQTDGEQEVVDLFNWLDERSLAPDCLVCNAANLGIGMDFFNTSREQFMSVFEVNLGWNFTLAREAAKRMKEKNCGSIVFITSNTAYRAIPDRCAYSSSKSGVLGLSRALAVDLGKYGIRSNCVLPGMIKTTRWQNTPTLHKVPSNFTPIGDIAEFEDIAAAAYFLSSPAAKNITGAELIVDGGNTIQLYPNVPKDI